VGNWADGLAQLLSDPGARKQLSERGDARAARFTWSASAERHDDAYREAVGRAGTRGRL
jgi:glycosyltransferase involved in cell wall biosynthesis